MSISKFFSATISEVTLKFWSKLRRRTVVDCFSEFPETPKSGAHIRSLAWVEAQGIADWTGTYREGMQYIGDNINNQVSQNALSIIPSQGITEQFNTATQQVNVNCMKQGSASPFVGNQQVQQTELNNRQNGAKLPPVNRQQAQLTLIHLEADKKWTSTMMIFLSEVTNANSYSK